MLSVIADTVFQNDLNDDILIEQMNAALQERCFLWNEQSDYIDPSIIKSFQTKWEAAYYTAKAKTARISYTIGFSSRKIHNTAKKFLEMYDQLPMALRSHNDIVARVKYLLKTGACMPSEILILSFTNASAESMARRLNTETGTSIPALTFHKLGLDIITSVQGIKPKINSTDIRKFVRQQLDNLLQDKVYFSQICIYLTYFSSPHKTEFDFTSNDEYQAYLRYNSPITLKKEKVKSYGELDIANFLTQNGISYIYEKEYPIDTRSFEYGQYYPDFYLPDFDLYIEYFGINRNGEVPSFFSGKNGMTASQAYQESIRWKRELQRK